MGFLGEGPARSFGDKFRVLAVTGAQRSSLFRDAPTFAELGQPQMRGSIFALSARVGVPKQALDKLRSAGSLALQQPEVKVRLAKLPVEILELSREAAEKILADEAKMYAETGALKK